ncbi:MAG: integrase domain-containing protein [Pseudomonadota bacterium]
MSKYPTLRNYGFGKQIAWAGHQALRDYYGHGHFASVQAHFSRWQQFCGWLRDYYGIRDAGAIKPHHLDDYAEHIAQQVEEDVMAVAYAQNLLSSVNVTLKALRGDGKLRIDSPAKWVGKRRHVRQELPTGYEWEQFQAAVDALYAADMPRAVAVVELARSLGLRLREAVLGDIPRWLRERDAHGKIDVREGTKGGRGKEVARWVPVDGAADCALENADSVRREQGCGNNLLKPHETYDGFVNDGEIHKARTILHRHGIKGYHELRAAWACDRYFELAGRCAPVVEQCSPSDEQSEEESEAVATLSTELGLELAQELGHNRLDVLAAYIGSHHRR